MSDKEELYLSNEYLARYTLKTYYPSFKQDEDWQQEAKMHLWKACLGFDETVGVTFSSYAVRAIKNGIANTVRKKYMKKRQGCDNIVSYDDPDIAFLLPSGGLGFVDKKGFYNALPECYRKTIFLLECGYNKTEVGKIQNIPMSTVYSRIKKSKPYAEAYI